MQRFLLTTALLFLFGGACFAREPFSIEVEVAGQSASTEFSNISDLIDAVDSDGFQSVNNLYNDNIGAVATLDIRGVDAEAIFVGADTSLLVNIEEIGFSRTFNGATRDESGEEFADFIENNGADLYRQITEYLIANSATDPIAGNPASLLDTMAAASFDAGFDSSADTPGEGGPGDKSQDRGKLELGLRIGRYSVDEIDHTTATLPFRYSFALSKEVAKSTKIVVDAPIRYLETGSAQTGAASFGLGFQTPVNQVLTVTPMVRSGVTGSVDLGALAAIGAASLTSRARLLDGRASSRGAFGRVPGAVLYLLNNVGYFHTRSIPVEDYDPGLNLNNGVIKNGLQLGLDTGLDIFDAPVSVEFLYANTHIVGDDVFIGNYNDVAAQISIGKWDHLKFGAQYTFGEQDFQKFDFNVGYRF